jgi:hypothetical protein
VSYTSTTDKASLKTAIAALDMSANPSCALAQLLTLAKKSIAIGVDKNGSPFVAPDNTSTAGLGFTPDTTTWDALKTTCDTAMTELANIRTSLGNL